MQKDYDMYIPYTDIEAFFGNYYTIVHVLDSNLRYKSGSGLSNAMVGNILTFLGADNGTSLIFSASVGKKVIINSSSLFALHAIFDERIGIISKYLRHTFVDVKGNRFDMSLLLDDNCSKNYEGKQFRINAVSPTYRIVDIDNCFSKYGTQEECYKWVEERLYAEDFDRVMGLICGDFCCKITEL